MDKITKIAILESQLQNTDGLIQECDKQIVDDLVRPDVKHKAKVLRKYYEEQYDNTKNELIMLLNPGI